MQGAGGEVEGAGVEEEEGAAAGGNGGEFGEADVVADGEGDEAVGGKGHEGEVVAWGEDVGFTESDFVGDVDVEEVDLSVGCHQFAFRAEQ